MKITLTIPDGMRIGEAIWNAFVEEYKRTGVKITKVSEWDCLVGGQMCASSDQDLISLLAKLQ